MNTSTQLKEAMDGHGVPPTLTWYKVNVDGKIGYVRGDLLCWDGMCTF